MAQSRVKYGRGWRGLKVHLETVTPRLEQAARDIVDDLVEEGAALMQARIHELDRIDTTKMISSVKFKHAKSSYFYGRFGWVDVHEDYFKYQDEGFRHWISGKHIPGMFALYDAFIQVREELKQRVEDLTK